jgi:MFS family permease
VKGGLARAWAPFRHGYRWLALALTLNVFAAGVWLIALIWEVIRLGGGPAQLSLVSTAASVGILVPALAAGVVADRIEQKSILLVVSAVECGGMALVTVLAAFDLTRIWHLAVISLVTGVALSFHYPAYSAWLPALVPEEDLLAVNGFEGMIRPTIGQAAGPAIAGFVVGAASPAAAFGIAVVASLAGVLVLFAVPRTPLRREFGEDEVHSVRSAARDIAEGVRYMVRTPWLLATLSFASILVLTIMGPIEVLIPFVIKDRLGGDATDHAWVMAAFGVGGAVGALAMAVSRMPRRYLTFMNLMWGVGSLPMVVFGLADEVWMMAATAFVLGVILTAPMAVWGTLLQRRVPAHMLGRVASLDFFVSLSLMPVSMALAAPVAELIGMRNTFLIAGVVPGVVALVAVFVAKLPQDEIAHPLD